MSSQVIREVSPEDDVVDDDVVLIESRQRC